MPTEPALSATEFAPSTQDELQGLLTTNHADGKRPLCPVGGRTALDFGGRLSRPVTTIDMSHLAQVVDFPARDMTITVEAGITIDRLAEILKVEGQRLPIDVSQSSRASLGGAIVTNTSGPRRFGCGTFRDYVIGLTAMTADGRVFHSGGRVVKNVAGYDLCKLLVGSVGTLAIVTQLTLKLKPIPESSLLVGTRFDKIADLDVAVGQVLNSQTRPVAIEALNSPAAELIERETRAALPAGSFVLIVGYEGSARETNWQADTLRSEFGGKQEIIVARDETASRLWAALTEFPVGSDDGLVFQADLLPSKVASFVDQASRSGVAILAHAADGTVIGKLAEHGGDAPKADTVIASLAELAHRSGGQLVLLRGSQPDIAASPVAKSPASTQSLMRELKRAFDPHDLLNPGRLFPSR